MSRSRVGRAPTVHVHVGAHPMGEIPRYVTTVEFNKLTGRIPS